MKASRRAMPDRVLTRGMFNGFTKIADALRLGPDDFAPMLHPRVNLTR